MSDFVIIFVLFIILPLLLCFINSYNEIETNTMYETCND